MSADERTHGQLALVQVIVIPTLHFFFPTGGEFGNVGDFVCIFIAVSYLKRQKDNILERHCVAVFVGLFVLMQVSLFSAHILCGKFGIGANLEKRILLHIYASRHFFIMTLAMSLFYVFKKYMRIGRSRFINALAGTTFGVYIFHENPLFHLSSGFTSAHILKVAHIFRCILLALCQKGIVLNHKTVHKLMRSMGLRGKVRRASTGHTRAKSVG